MSLWILTRFETKEDRLVEVLDLYTETMLHRPWPLKLVRDSLWQRERFPKQFLTLHGFANENDAKTYQQSIGATNYPEQFAQICVTPPNIVYLECTHAVGGHMLVKPDEDFLSISHRIAEPGYGEQLAEEIEMIFSELTMIAGFRAGLVCVNQALEEEVYSFASWSKLEAFLASLPEIEVYKVLAYHRLK
ncbi:MAG: hypothetical protein JSS72_01695 [Armatimonadetes bacterium]|nr:hypothetical protein [Armatimonadota bacterium]